MSTESLPTRLRSYIDEDDDQNDHAAIRALMVEAAEALETPLQPRDPWRDERHLFGGSSLLSVEEIEHLRRVRHYFEDRWPNIGEPPDARDARRYRRLRILGAAIGESKELRDGTVSRFQNLDELVDADLYRQPGRGEVRDNLAVDWNDQAKAVLSKVIALHSLGQV